MPNNCSCGGKLVKKTLVLATATDSELVDLFLKIHAQVGYGARDCDVAYTALKAEVFRRIDAAVSIN